MTSVFALIAAFAIGFAVGWLVAIIRIENDLD